MHLAHFNIFLNLILVLTCNIDNATKIKQTLKFTLAIAFLKMGLSIYCPKALEREIILKNRKRAKF